MTTDAMPQTMPSMVSSERMRLRMSEAQLWLKTMPISLAPQALDRGHLGGAASWIHAGGHGDKAERYKCGDNGLHGHKRRGDKFGTRRGSEHPAEAQAGGKAEESAEAGEHDGF